MPSSEWISVEDRLPDKNIRVWAFYEASTHHSGVDWNRNGCWFAVWWGGEWNYAFTQEALSELDADEVKLTHWVLLPEPPND